MIKIESILKRCLRRNKINELNTLQKNTLESILDRKNTLILSQTGTGKTLSFVIPLLTLYIKNNSSKFLIISPTRELSLQIQKVINMFKSLDLKMTVLIGGYKYDEQVKELSTNSRIIIGTLGRLKEHYERGWIFNDVEMIVLDEVDKLLENNFKSDLDYVLSNFNPETQMVCATATYSNVVSEFLKDKKINTIKMIDFNAVPSVITHKLIFVPQKYKEAGLYELIKRFTDKKVLVFFSSCHKVKLFKRLFDLLNLNITEIYGEMDQKERKAALEEYRKTGKIFSTDLLARGIDFDVDVVVHYDMPNKPCVYVHRSGRTGRNGKDGMVYNIVTQYEINKILNYEEELNIKVIKDEIDLEKLSDKREEIENHKYTTKIELKEKENEL